MQLSMKLYHFISNSNFKYKIIIQSQYFNQQRSQLNISLILSSMTQVSQDIFYQVKKQILDKLDIILQKVNLQIIDYIKPNQKDFQFIELSQFQKQIHVLFQYLDRLYASLNSSVSFSSNDINSYATNLKEENYRLAQQNQKLKSLIKLDLHEKQKERKPTYSIDSLQWKNNICRECLAIYEKKEKSSQFSSKMHHSTHLNNNPSDKNLYSISQSRASIGIDTVKKILKFYNHSIMLLSKQFQQFQKSVKKTLKDQKFRIIQNRVQYIARHKEHLQHMQNASLYEQHQADKLVRQNHSKDNRNILKSSCGNKNCNLSQRDQEILEVLNQILQIC